MSIGAFVLALLLLTPTTAAADSLDDAAARVRACLAGDLPPTEVVDRATFERLTYLLKCGSPISYGVLHIDDGHKIDNAKNFIACFRRLVVEAGPAEEDPFRPYMVRKMNVDLGNIKAVMAFELNGNVVTIYQSGNAGNKWAACARVSPF